MRILIVSILLNVARLSCSFDEVWIVKDTNKNKVKCITKGDGYALVLNDDSTNQNASPVFKGISKVLG